MLQKPKCFFSTTLLTVFGVGINALSNIYRGREPEKGSLLPPLRSTKTNRIKRLICRTLPPKRRKN